MAITFTLVHSSTNRLRYLAVNSGSPLGGTASIPNDGGATPDLLTDVVAGPIRAVVRARLDGIGTVAAGALSQAQARAAMNEDGTVSIGNVLVPRTRTTVTPRSGTSAWVVDVNVDGAGDPVVAVTSTAAAGDAYIDIQTAGSAFD